MKIDLDKRLAGVLIPVFALRHQTDMGIGDTRAVREAIEFCADYDISVLQVLPINETGGDNSPYNAVSSVALDPALLYVAPEVVPGLSIETFEGIAPEHLLRELRSGSVNYPRVKSLKLEILERAFECFDDCGPDSKDLEAASFSRFQDEHQSWLTPYTLFRSLMQDYQGNACWSQWAPEVHTYALAERWLSDSPHRERLNRSRRFFAYVQWLAFRQWKELRSYADSLGVQLMGDIPFGISRYSADVWASSEIFDLEWSGGAPPERYFQADPFTHRWGQNWGIPLYRWSAHRKDDFAWWRERVERLAEFFHLFRIDHVLGFFRVYAFPWIPERNGEFVNLSPDEAAALTGGRLPQFLPHGDEPPDLALLNRDQGVCILKVILEAAGNIGVVAEDLGVVPDYVRPALRELNIPGFYIPIFERNEPDRSFKAKEEIPRLSLATYATHDHQPLRVYYEGLVKSWLGPDGHQAWLELQALMRFLGLDCNHPPRTFTPALHRAFLEVLMGSPTWLAMFMITDVLLSSDRFNEPGVGGDFNWSRRLDLPLKELSKEPFVAERLNLLQDVISRTGRGLKTASAPVE